MVTFWVVLYLVGFVFEYCSSYKTATTLDPASETNAAVAGAVALIWPLLLLIALVMRTHELLVVKKK